MAGMSGDIIRTGMIRKNRGRLSRQKKEAIPNGKASNIDVLLVRCILFYPFIMAGAI